MEDNVKFEFKRELAALATIRDELKLKAHLARAEVREELDRLESKWRAVDEEVERTKAHAKDSAAEVQRSLRDLLHDLKQGYQNVRQRLD